MAVLQALYLKLFSNSIKELLYEASEANVNCDISSNSEKGIGIELCFSGFDESIPVLAE